MRRGPLAALVLFVCLAAGIAVWALGARGAPTPVADAPPAGARDGDAGTRAIEDAGAGRTATPAAAPTASDAALRTPPAPIASTPVVRVRGRVLDARGAGVAGARVSAAGIPTELPFAVLGTDDLAPAGGVTTGADGSFELGLEAQGAFRLVATHRAHPRAEHRGEAATELVEGIVIVLRDGASIRGRVVGVPEGAGELTVSARRSRDAAVEASALGIDLGELAAGLGVALPSRSVAVGDGDAFLLEGLDPDASYELWCTRIAERGRAPLPCSARIDVRAGASGVELPWRVGPTVGLRVVDDGSGQPIEQLAVEAGTVREISVLGMKMPVAAKRPIAQRHFAGGDVLVDELEAPGSEPLVVAIAVRAHGFRAWSREDIAVPGAGHVDLGVVRLLAAPIVRVTVRERVGGAPIAGAAVELAEFEPPRERDEGPRRSISISTSMTTGTRDAGGWPGELGAGAGDVELTAGEAGGDRHRATTDAEGRCEITADFTGTAVLRVRAAAHAPHVGEDFALPVRGLVERDVELVPGGTVVVTAVDSEGKALAAIPVHRAGPTKGDDEKLPADGDGVARFLHVTPGRHRFRLADDAEHRALGGWQVAVRSETGDERDTGTPVDVADGGSFSIELVQPARATLRGVVTLDGAPLVGADVRLTDPDGDAAADAAADLVESMIGGLAPADRGPRVRTGESGEFELEARAGTARLVVRHATLAMPAFEPVELAAGANRHDVAIRATTVSGRVLGPDGAPIAGATVSLAADTGARVDAELARAQAFMSGMLGGASTGVRTDDDGRFALRGVRAGTALVLRATARRHVAEARELAPLAAGAHRDDLVLTLAAAGRVSVIATDVQGAMVATAEWAGTDTGASAPAPQSAPLRNGRTTIDGLRPGRWTITLGPDLGGITPRTTDVVAGETARVEFGR